MHSHTNELVYCRHRIRIETYVVGCTLFSDLFYWLHCIVTAPNGAKTVRYLLKMLFNKMSLSFLTLTKLGGFSPLFRTIFLVLLFSQYARNVHFPLPVYKAKKGWTFYRLQVFKMFPVGTPLSPSPCCVVNVGESVSN